MSLEAFHSGELWSAIVPSTALAHCTNLEVGLLLLLRCLVHEKAASTLPLCVPHCRPVSVYFPIAMWLEGENGVEDAGENRKLAWACHSDRLHTQLRFHHRAE